jgi:hypothetical protein
MRASGEGGSWGVIILFVAGSSSGIVGLKPDPRIAPRVHPQAPGTPVGTLVANAGIKPPDDGLCASLSPTALACTGLGASSIARVRPTPPDRRACQEGAAAGGGDRLRGPPSAATSAFSMSP